jgi:glutathione S-transferase
MGGARGQSSGDGFSLADIDLLPILYYLQSVPEGTEAVKSNKNLPAYYERHAERPCFKATIPPHLPGR